MAKLEKKYQIGKNVNLHNFPFWRLRSLVEKFQVMAKILFQPFELSLNFEFPNIPCNDALLTGKALLVGPALPCGRWGRGFACRSLRFPSP